MKEMTVQEFRKVLRRYEVKNIFQQKNEYIALYHELIKQVKPERREMARRHFERNYYTLD